MGSGIWTCAMCGYVHEEYAPEPTPAEIGAKMDAAAAKLRPTDRYDEAIADVAAWLERRIAWLTKEIRNGGRCYEDRDHADRILALLRRDFPLPSSSTTERPTSTTDGLTGAPAADSGKSRAGDR